MALIESSYVFFTSEAIFLRESLNPSMRPHTFQKVSIPFTDIVVKEKVQNALKYLNLVKETPKNL